MHERDVAFFNRPFQALHCFLRLSGALGACARVCVRAHTHAEARALASCVLRRPEAFRHDSEIIWGPCDSQRLS